MPLGLCNPVMPRRLLVLPVTKFRRPSALLHSFTMTTTALPPTPSHPHCSHNFNVVIPVNPRSKSDSLTSSASTTTLVASSADFSLAPPAAHRNEDPTDSDDDLSDTEIERLLQEASERMSKVASETSSNHNITLPKLDPGPLLPKAPITTQGAIARLGRNATVPIAEQKLSDGDLAITINDTSSKNGKKKQEGPAPTAGAKWFDMPRTDLTPQVKRDIQIIKARNVLDPHRHYKKDSSAIPEFSQMGTIIEGNTEFFNSRIARKERKKTIVDEILGDASSTDRFKRKYGEIQKGKKSGKKEHYKKLMEQRKRLKFAK